MLTSMDVEDACKGYTLENTIRENPMIEILNQWLAVFIMEAYKEDGGRHPASTINQLLWRAHVLSLHRVRIRIL